MTATIPAVGVDAFIAGLGRCGVEAAREGGVVTFSVEAVTRSGRKVVRTGVAAAELQAWPGVPPHWVHLPVGIQLTRTNADATETLPGWTRHSRDIQNWGNATEPAQAWLAHVRSVLQEAL
ncbi:hypothetical protein [Amycolatopsis sp. NPDC051061]|uniref:hypothetical protein n=1 Tax=Amycolatopsis sp. NPDC051061 TaxID=3155042 RepID=UPI003424074B